MDTDIQTNYNYENMNIVIVGHVDHGKSTVIGRLMADTGSLPDGKLEQVKENCRRTSRPFEYAFLLDALKDEQSQGITIDSARVFFKTEKRHYIIIDAPGHIEFLKNMVTGAARAEAALLVIDAEEGVQENSRRHGYLLAMLGISQIAVLVNKMDLVDYDRDTFERIRDEYSEFLREIGVSDAAFVPVSGMEGDNVASHMERMPWYSGHTVLDILDSFEKSSPPDDRDFRMPVQGVYKFTNFGDSRRIIAGTVDTGRLNVGDEVIFYPSGKRSRVKTIERFNAEPASSTGAGWATGFTLEEQIYVTRGEMAARRGEVQPETTTRFRVNLFWLGREPLVQNKEYLLKLGSARVTVFVEEIVMALDASNLDTRKKERVERHDVAECILRTTRPLAFDPAERNASTGRFVLVDNYEIWGGGIIREALEDRQTQFRDLVFTRNLKWEKSRISFEERAEKYHQKPALVLVTGIKDSGKKPLARELEVHLFNEGQVPYFLGFGNILYGVDSDLLVSSERKDEHVRRFAEVVNIMLDAGLIVIATAIEFDAFELEVLKTIINPDRIHVVWTGEEITTDIPIDINADPARIPESVEMIRGYLGDRGIVYRPY
jgi:bifunctional enzyme CysN/CysC